MSICSAVAACDDDDSGGVCCPIGSSGCSSEGPGGGWAPDEASCPKFERVYDAYFKRAKDSHGCPLLIEDDNMCCGCPPSDADADGGKDGGGDAGWIDPGFRVSLVGVSVVLEARTDAMLSYLTCQNAIAVEKREGGAWVPMRDDRPPSSQNPGYYLDGKYVPESFNLGCDMTACTSFNDTTEVGRAEEYVNTGSKAPPAGEHSRDAEVAMIETRAFHGALRVLVQYFRDAMCQEDTHAVSLELEVPEQGVCCPIGDETCSSPGPGGGWAANMDACPPYSTLYDAYVTRKADAHGCPVLVEDDSVCCGCPSAADAGN